MKTLPYDVSRCSGRYSFRDGLSDDPGNWCPERDTCQRYLAFVKWDKDAGIPDYRGISVTMAAEECGIKIELERTEK